MYNPPTPIADRLLFFGEILSLLVLLWNG